MRGRGEVASEFIIVYPRVWQSMRKMREGEGEGRWREGGKEREDVKKEQREGRGG